jgi:hypothetical protein
MESRNYLLVEFSEKDLAKKNNCKWDTERKMWYCLENDNVMIKTHTRVDLLCIKYEDRELVKNLGAKWDNSKKCWYCKSGNRKVLEIEEKFLELVEEKMEKDLQLAPPFIKE